MSYLNNLSAIRKAVLALILANIFWGAGFPIAKWTLEELPTFTFAFLRFFVAAIIIFPFVYNKLRIARQDYKYLILAGLISVSLQIPLMFYGLKLAPSINAPIIIATGPIILIIASILFIHEKVKIKTISGTLISLLGVIVIIIEPLILTGFIGASLGNFLLFLATICGVIQIILLKKLTVRNNVMTILFWIFLIGSLPMIPFVIWELQSFNLLTDTSSIGFIGIFYGIFITAILAHYLHTYGISKIKASEVGIFSYVDPIAAILIAIPLLGEKITVSYVIGSILVFLGIFIAEGRIHYHPFHRLFEKNEKLPNPTPSDQNL